MATKNYVICVGGVGARILEGIVRLCECGYIAEDELNCIMVDVDKSNGNASSVKRLITSYNGCRKVIGAENNAEGVGIFKTKIVGAGAEGSFNATPISSGTANVSIQRNLVGKSEDDDLNTEANNIMKAFFTKEEYTRVLDQGFYANPLIGSLFFNEALESQNNDNNGIYALLNKMAGEIKDGHIVKIFISGSVFGGTGASGLLPLCVKLLNLIEEEAENDGVALNERRNNLHIFGCLMLPYFKYADGTAPKGAIIDHKEFNETARYVLEGYNILINSDTKDKVFDKLYMVGDPDKTTRGLYFEQGSQQCNWPHVLELFAASEAGKFFAEPHETPQEGEEPYARPAVYADPFEIEGGNIHALQWGDYGRNDRTKSDKLQKSIEDFHLFNYYFSTYLVPLFYDFSGATGKYLESWLPDKKTKKSKARFASLPTWAKKAFIEEEGGIFGFFTKKRWKYSLSAEFAEVYKYFTESAQWYYKVIHVFPSADEHKPCWESSPEGVHTCSLSECQKNKSVLLSFFGADGAKMLARRTCMPKRSEFISESKSFLDNIEQSALLDARELPEFDSLDLGKNTDRSGYSVFQELIKKAFVMVQSTRTIARG